MMFRSVRGRFYEQSDMDDVLQDKIATQLRNNGIAETKVVPLSAKITQAVRDDVIDANSQVSPQVTANLKEVINKHLDPILFNKPDITDLKEANKPSDAKQLSSLVLLRVGQVHEELDLCKRTVDSLAPKTGRTPTHTPREEPQERSMIMAIQDGLKNQKTERDILADRLRDARKETQQVAGDKEIKSEKLQNMDADNWKLRRSLNELEQDKHKLAGQVKERQKELNSLHKQVQELQQQNNKLRHKLEDSGSRNQVLAGDLTKLQTENARLKVLLDQMQKEILHLQQPDQDMLHQIRILSDEVTMLRTQTRRLNEEKGLLRSRSQKLESTLDETFKQKNALMAEKDKLEAENEDLKQRYRKLALANPQTRTLPDINGARTGTSSRSHSRALSVNPRRTEDPRMSTTREEDADDSFDR